MIRSPSVGPQDWVEEPGEDGGEEVGERSAASMASASPSGTGSTSCMRRALSRPARRARARISTTANTTASATSKEPPAAYVQGVPRVPARNAEPGDAASAADTDTAAPASLVWYSEASGTQVPSSDCAKVRAH